MTQATVANDQERMLRNTSYLTLAFVIQKILSFFYFIIVARAIGASDLGLYDPVKSLIPITLILIDFSLSPVLTREIARDPDKLRSSLGAVLAVKILFATSILLIAGFATNFSSLSPQTKSIIYLDGVIVALDTFTITLFSVFRGLQNLKYEAIGMILTQFLSIGLGLTFLRLGAGLQGLFFAVLAGSILNFTFSISIFRRKIGYFPPIHWNRRIIKNFLKMALPFAIAAFLVKIYTYADRFLLLKFADQRNVGWYVTAHKLTFALEFIPSAFAAAFYPAMSAYFISSLKDLSKTFERAFYYLTIVAVPISFGVFALATPLILKLYGPVFTRSIVPLQIMILGLTVIFLNFPVGAFLNAVNRQSINTVNMAIVVVVNIILNTFLIRAYNEVGAAVATLVSSYLLFFLGLRWVGKVIPYNRHALLVVVGKSLFAAAIMAIILSYVSSVLPFTTSVRTIGIERYLSVMLYFGILAAIGSVVYLGLLMTFRAVNRRDLILIFHAIKRKIL